MAATATKGATIMVYQAVAEYWSSFKEPTYTLDVELSLPGKSSLDSYTFTNENHYITRSDKFVGINKSVNLTATGNGEGMFQMVSLYYALPSNLKEECDDYDLKLSLQEEKATETGKVFKLRIDLLYKSKTKEGPMSILDVGLPTGYIFDKNDLDALSKGRDRIISKYETDSYLSSRGSVIIYMNKVSHTLPDEISFRIHQALPVGVLQPAAVSVYKYYDPKAFEKRCVRFYRPERESGALQKLCTNGDEDCICAEEDCTMQKGLKVDNNDRTKKACETKNSKIDFVYKIQVEKVEHGSTTDMYTVRVLRMFKHGTKDEGALNQLRAFLSYSHCRDALALEKDKTYLVMGTSADIHLIKQNLRYMFGQNTWVEYWPTKAECQSAKYRATCLGMVDLEEQLEDFGCHLK